jgi:hypothetical protein
MLWIQSLNDEVADVEFFHIFILAYLLIIAGSFFCHFLSWYFNSSSQIKRLQLVGCYGISDEGLSGVAAKLPLLEELAISYCPLSTFALKDVGRSCPLLKSLKFNGAGLRYGEIDAEALAIAENMSELRCLQLFGNMLTDDGLQAILDGCPHLESLDLRECFSISFAGNLERRCAEQIKDLRLPHDSTDDYEFNAYRSFDDVSGGFSDIDHLSNTFYKNFQIKEQGKGDYIICLISMSIL